MAMDNKKWVVEDLAVYKSICKLPLTIEEVSVLLKKDYSQLISEHELDMCQGNMLTAWLMSELRRYKMQHLSGNRSEEVDELLKRIV